MGEAFMPRGGGGAALNFKVLAYATEEALLAATPAENTIGIITETPITSWIFSADEPSPAAAGMVWITTGTASSVEFNALKKNGLQVYPISAKQHVGGAWVDKVAKSYQGGELVDWWDGELYESGNLYEHVTGGWVMVNGAQANGTIEDGIIYLSYSTTGSSPHSTAYTKNRMDLSGYSKLTATLQVTESKHGEDSWPSILISDQNTDAYPAHSCVAIVGWTRNTTGTAELEMDISDYQGLYYVGAWASACKAQVVKIKLQ